MTIKDYLNTTEDVLKGYKNIIGITIITLLVVLIFVTVKNFDKQNEIIETGGFIDGKVKCVCTQEAWDMEYGENNIILNLSEYNNG
jgi:competence protein ComGC